MTVRAWTAENPPAGAQPGCPEWCTEHYDTPAGASNHSSTWRSVTVGGADTGAILPLSTWLESRHWPDGSVDTVGIIRRATEDVELTPDQLRDFAKHLTAVAAEVEQTAAAAGNRRDDDGTSGVRVTVHIPEGGREVELTVALPAGDDKVLLSPAGARRLGSVLLAAGKQPGRPSRERR